MIIKPHVVVVAVQTITQTTTAHLGVILSPLVGIGFVGAFFDAVRLFEAVLGEHYYRCAVLAGFVTFIHFIKQC